MAVSQNKRAIGVFPTRQEAERALHELRDSGFPMDKVSVVVRDADRNDDIAGADVSDRVGNKADEGATTGAITGGALGGLTGLLVGLGALAIPGIGPVMLAGAAATTIATTLSGTAIGAAAGSLLGALIGLGIPEERARVYNERVSKGEYLVIVDGTQEEVTRAEAILNRGGIQEFGVYDAPGAVYNAPAATIPATTTDTSFGTQKHAVGIFANRQDAEQAFSELRHAGFTMRQVSLVVKDLDMWGPFPDLNVRDRFDAMRLGFPDDRARFYQDRVNRGEYLVIVDGTDEEIRHAAQILSARGIKEWQIYDPSQIPASSGYTASTSGVGVAGIGRRKRAIGVFPYRRDAEAALNELRDSGFGMDDVSVIAKDADRDDSLAGADLSDRVGSKVGNQADEGAKTGAATGGALGGLTGLLVGLGALAIPGIGPVMLGGAAATALATTLAGGAIGATAGGLGGALVGMGIPDAQATIYNDRVSRGYYLVIVDGTEAEIHRAEAILKRHGIQDYEIYDAPGVDTTRSDRNVTPAVAAAPSAFAATTAQPRAGIPLGNHKRAIGVFPHRHDAESALRELKDSGFPMDRVSVIAKDADSKDNIAGAEVSDRVGTKTGNQADEGAKTGAATGGAVGGLTGLLVGLGALAIPGIGPVMLGGATATALATALTGGAIGAAAGGLGGALVGLGVPDERAKIYNNRVSHGDYLVIVDGTDNEIGRAGAILSSRGIQEWGIYDAPGVAPKQGGDVVEPSVTRTVDTTTSADAQVVSRHPEVTIIDRRDETL